MANLFQLPRTAPLYAGASLAGAKLYFFEPGTTTAITTYTTSALSVAHNHPVVADSDGVFAAIYIKESVNKTYRVQLKTSADVLKYDEDNVVTQITAADVGAWAGTAGGSANAITLTPSPAITAYATGHSFRFISASANTTAVTVAVSGLATKAITKNGSTALVEGDIPSGAIVTISYDGTQFQMVGLIANDWGIYTATATGGTTSPTYSVRYAIAGKLVALYVPATTMTSNTTAFTLTGAPAALRPSTLDSALMLATAFTDNSVVEYGLNSAKMTTAGTLEFYRNTSATGYTNTGTKGLTMASMFVYNLNTTPP